MVAVLVAMSNTSMEEMRRMAAEKGKWWNSIGPCQTLRSKLYSIASDVGNVKRSLNWSLVIQNEISFVILGCDAATELLEPHVNEVSSHADVGSESNGNSSCTEYKTLTPERIEVRGANHLKRAAGLIKNSLWLKLASSLLYGPFLACSGYPGKYVVFK